MLLHPTQRQRLGHDPAHVIAEERRSTAPSGTDAEPKRGSRNQVSFLTQEATASPTTADPSSVFDVRAGREP
jgi:hypothetical protein